MIMTVESVTECGTGQVEKASVLSLSLSDYSSLQLFIYTEALMA